MGHINEIIEAMRHMKEKKLPIILKILQKIYIQKIYLIQIF